MTVFCRGFMLCCGDSLFCLCVLLNPDHWREGGREKGGETMIWEGEVEGTEREEGKER